MTTKVQTAIKLQDGEVIVSCSFEKYRTLAVSSLGNVWALSRWDSPHELAYAGTRYYWKKLKFDTPWEEES